tara:strand:- start:67 stop:285 length:219 start_codon:yes stop_codon:yes gene_type:complete
MKKKLISVCLASVLLVNCASSKPEWDRKPAPDNLIEVMGGEDRLGEKGSKGLMEILVSGLILYTLYIFTTPR